MSFDVFISHPHQDKAIADAACAKLEAAGIRCWIAPRDIAPSADWASSIVDAIDNCRVMVLIFSGHTNRSRQVGREVQQAFDAEKPVVPFRIEDVTPQGSFRYYMGSVHWLDALTPPVEEHLQKLVAAVHALVKAGALDRDRAGERKRFAADIEGQKAEVRSGSPAVPGEASQGDEQDREPEGAPELLGGAINPPVDEQEASRLQPPPAVSQALPSAAGSRTRRSESATAKTIVPESAYLLTGCVSAIGALLYAYWLLSLGNGPEAFSSIRWLSGTPGGLVVFVIYAAALLVQSIAPIRECLAAFHRSARTFSTDPYLVLAVGTPVVGIAMFGVMVEVYGKSRAGVAGVFFDSALVIPIVFLFIIAASGHLFIGVGKIADILIANPSARVLMKVGAGICAVGVLGGSIVGIFRIMQF